MGIACEVLWRRRISTTNAGGATACTRESTQFVSTRAKFIRRIWRLFLRGAVTSESTACRVALCERATVIAKTTTFRCDTVRLVAFPGRLHRDHLRVRLVPVVLLLRDHLRAHRRCQVLAARLSLLRCDDGRARITPPRFSDCLLTPLPESAKEKLLRLRVVKHNRL